jgi:transmembrane sensor
MHLSDGVSGAAVSEAVALQAARWFLLMRSGEASAADQARLQRWRGADAAHEIAWQRAQRLQEQFSDLPPALAVPVLGRGGSVDRRAVLKTVAALLIAPSAGWLAWRTAPVREWLAEHRSGTGETRLVRLGDGTRVWLDTASAFDVVYGPTERLLYLRAGRILIETAPDAVPEGTPGHRPFVVACAHGRLRALGTRFDVRDTDTDRSRLGVMQGAVEVRPAQAPELSVVVLAGQQAAFSSRRIDGPRPLEGQADAWAQGVLRARDMRLDAFLAELGRYRPGVIRCSAEVASLRISGAFQLSDTGAVLDSLPRALPVTVRYRTRYWVSVAGQDA